MERIHISVCLKISLAESTRVHLDQTILNHRPAKTDIAVIMYTSGSTGTPKGQFFFLTYQRSLMSVDGDGFEKLITRVNEHKNFI